MTSGAEVVWLPFVYPSTYRRLDEPKNARSWIAERQPFLIEASPAREPAIVLRAGGSEMIWRTDGEALFRDVTGPDGDPLAIADIEALDEQSGRERLLFGHWGRNDALIDYPLAACDRENAAGASYADVIWRERLIAGTTRGVGRPKQLKKWIDDGQVEGVRRAREAASDLRHQDGRLVKRDDEPLIGVHLDRARTVVVQIWIGPDYEENAIAFRAISRLLHDRPTQNRAETCRFAGVAFFRLDQAEAARRCAETVARDVGGGAEALDFLPEIELTGAWTPQSDLAVPTLRTLVSHIRMKSGSHELHGPAAEAEVMARRALRFAERGDERLVEHAMTAIVEEGACEPDSVIDAFRRLNQSADDLRDRGPVVDLGDAAAMRL